MERFDMFAEQSNAVAVQPQPVTSSVPVANGNSLPSPPQKRSADPEGIPDVTDSSPPPVKKRKDDVVDSDAAYAAKLQAEENLRARTTRGANSRKTGVVKKKRKNTSKTTKKVKASDDSDVDGSAAENKKEVNRTGGFHVCNFVPCRLPHVSRTAIDNFIYRNHLRSHLRYLLYLGAK